MKAYYCDLATSRLHEAAKNISQAMEYLHDADPINPHWITKNLQTIQNSVNKRIKDIHILREPGKQD
jgi:hypothetical protein